MNNLNILELGLNKAVVDLGQYSTFIYGIPKIGKTTFVRDLYGERVLFLATENRHKTITGTYVMNITSWLDFQTVLAQLGNPAVKDKFDVICIDTVDNLAGFLETFIKSKYNESELGNAQWGKDWSDLKDSWKTSLKIIEALGYACCFVSHGSQKTFKLPISDLLPGQINKDIMTEKKVKDKVTGEEEIYMEFDKYIPDLNDRYLAPINKMVDNILFLNQEIDSTGKPVRVIHTRDTVQWQAGSTFAKIKSTIPLSAQAYKDAVNEALNEFAPEESTTEVKELIREERPFDVVMNEAKELGTQLAKANKKEILTKIVNDIFGTGNLLSDANETQIQQLELAIVKFKEELNK